MSVSSPYPSQCVCVVGVVGQGTVAISGGHITVIRLMKHIIFLTGAFTQRKIFKCKFSSNISAVKVTNKVSLDLFLQIIWKRSSFTLKWANLDTFVANPLVQKIYEKSMF